MIEIIPDRSLHEFETKRHIKRQRDVEKIDIDLLEAGVEIKHAHTDKVSQRDGLTRNRENKLGGVHNIVIVNTAGIGYDPLKP